MFELVGVSRRVEAVKECVEVVLGCRSSRMVSRVRVVTVLKSKDALG